MNKYEIVIILKQPDIVKKVQEKSDRLRISRTDLVKIALAYYLNGGGSHE